MTTEELVLQINRNNRVRAEKIDGRIFVYNDTSHLLFTFDEKATNFLDFTFNDQLPADSMGKASREYVAAQIEEYLQTPINERSRELYTLVWPCGGDGTSNWLARQDGNWILSTNDPSGFPREALFSQKDLDEIVRRQPFMKSVIEALKQKVPVVKESSNDL